MTLRSAVVGAGVVSNSHLSGLDACPRTSLVAVCDIDEDRARSVADEWNITPYVDLGEMLESEPLDWLHVCTSVQSHLPLATTALEAGVPVLIEKPVTESVAEFEELVETAEATGVPFSVVHNHRWDPAMREARERLAAGEVGDVRGVDLAYTGLSRPDDHHRGSWVFDLAGGEFAEGLPHPLYLAIDAAGYPTARADIDVRTSCFGDYDQEFSYDSAQVQYVSEGGTPCSIQMLGGGHAQRQLWIYGERGTLCVDFVSQTVTPLSRSYTDSKAGIVLNNVDRVTAAARGTAKNLLAYARQRWRGDWESRRELNPHYYCYDMEAQALERGEWPSETVRRARWTTTILEELEATPGRDVEMPRP